MDRESRTRGEAPPVPCPGAWHSPPFLIAQSWSRLCVHFGHSYMNFPELPGHDSSMNPAFPELMGWHK